jgi:Peptidase_G2, IMC autoproteolytic cleavage domain
VKAVRPAIRVKEETMHRAERPTMKRAGLPLYAATILTLLAALLLPGAASAQWTTTGTNITNSNSGNVGVGTGSNAPASRLEVVNPAGGYVSGNYFQVTGTTADNNNYPGFQLKGGSWATEYPQFKLGNAGLAALLYGGRSATYTNRMGLLLSSEASGNAYASVQKFDGTNTSDLFVVRDSGNVGVGTLTPGYRLHVSGNNTSAGGYPVIKLENTQTGGHSFWLYAGATGTPAAFGLYDETAAKYRFFFDSSGNLGVGTTIPGNALSVQGGASITGALLVDASGSLGSNRVMLGSATQGSGGSMTLTTLNASGSGWNTGLYMNNVGSVGVGTTSPQNPLTIARSGSAPYATRPAYELLQLVDKTDNTPQILFGTAFNGMMLRYTGTDGTATNQRLGVITGGAGEAFVINNNGLVGIGTTGPAYRLDVAGSVNSTGLCLAGDCKTAWSQVGGGSSQWANTGSNIYFNSGSVGVGIATVGNTRLNVQGADSTSANYALFVQNSSNANLLSVRDDGNVGVGTNNPTHKLEVGGDTNVTGNLTVAGTGNITASGAITGATVNATYQDVAEWVPSTQKLSAGTVVVLDTGKTNHVLASTKAYDTGVAGVVSDSPGVILGQGGADKVKVATTGRVKVRVDATRAPIHVGDLLVTSEAEGVAMKSIPVDLGGTQIHRPGTIIGKALEPLEKGTGEILVLLSLQ